MVELTLPVPILALILLLVLFAVSVGFSFEKLVPFPLDWFGLVISLVGIALSQKGKHYFWKKKTTVERLETPALLVTDSVFAYSRNPMYGGMVLLLFGIFLFVGTLPMLFLPLIFFFVIQFAVIPHEEKKLTKLFGQEYKSYCSRVRRWV
jgi:protein-S-isoprenylcysteine O-methyltransferase Ste14